MKERGPSRTAALVRVRIGALGSTAPAAEVSPCQGAIDQLLMTYQHDAAFRALTDRALANVQPLPKVRRPNPWRDRDIYAIAYCFARCAPSYPPSPVSPTML
jgi:hypothetical protein